MKIYLVRNRRTDRTFIVRCKDIGALFKKTNGSIGHSIGKKENCHWTPLKSEFVFKVTYQCWQNEHMEGEYAFTIEAEEKVKFDEKLSCECDANTYMREFGGLDIDLEYLASEIAEIERDVGH